MSSSFTGTPISTSENTLSIMTCVVNIEDTVTVHEAVAEALSMLVTLITAVPGDTAVTTPD